MEGLDHEDEMDHAEGHIEAGFDEHCPVGEEHGPQLGGLEEESAFHRGAQERLFHAGVGLEEVGGFQGGRAGVDEHLQPRQVQELQRGRVHVSEYPQ